MNTQNKNTLYPIFLKLNKLDLLIVGGGNVGLEKVSFILKNSPDAKITMIATFFLDALRELVKDYNVTLIERAFEDSDLKVEILWFVQLIIMTYTFIS